MADHQHVEHVELANAQQHALAIHEELSLQWPQLEVRYRQDLLIKSKR